MSNNLLGYASAFEKAHGKRAGRMENVWDVSHSIGLERQEELEAEKRRASSGGLARLFGGGAAGLLAAVLTGPMSLPLSAAITGLASGAGGAVARGISGAQNQVGVGKWDVAQGEQREEDYRSGIVSGGISDAITSGLMAYSMPDILKFLKGTPKVRPTSGWGEMFRGTV